MMSTIRPLRITDRRVACPRCSSRQTSVIGWQTGTPAREQWECDGSDERGTRCGFRFETVGRKVAPAALTVKE